MPASTLVDLLRSRARHDLFYTYVTADGTAQEWSFAEIDRRARAIGATLAGLGMAGRHVLLLYPPGLDYVAAFFGCLYGGAVAVPVFPPNPTRLDRTLPRLMAVAVDTDPAAVLSTAETLALAQGVLDLPRARWLATDTVAAEAADSWVRPDIGSSAVALVQYTSGSTSTPKGVLLDHGNLLHNSALIQECFGTTPATRGMSWLPLYHDMGLIGGILQPLYVGFSMTLMSPLTFLARPMSWLQEVSRRGITVTGGPNFAYDLSVRKFDPAACEGLDLSRWEVAFNGAEPIREDTLDRFAEAFGPYGFRRSAFLPCYGLAEATLIVTGRQPTQQVRTLRVDGIALAGGRAEPVSTGGVPLLSSGPPIGDVEVSIVDPVSDAACPDGGVGEIRVRSASLSRGYWRRPDETGETFGGGPDRLLRTGDLGFLHDGELYVTGRRKDLIIVRGRNVYPQDLELTATQADTRVRPGCAAAFGLSVDGNERVVLVAELAPGGTDGAAAEVAERIRTAVVRDHEVPVHRVVLIDAGQMPKTSSGKLQRGLCRTAFLDGTLDVVAIGGPAEPAEAGPVDVSDVRQLHGRARTDLLLRYLSERLAAATGLDPAAVTPLRAVDEIGLDSLASMELLHRIERDLRVSLPLDTLLVFRPVSALAGLVDEALSGGAGTAPELPESGETLLSDAQRSLWFLAQLAPGTDAYHLSRAFTVRPGDDELDAEVLDRALAWLVARHEALRTILPSRGGQPTATVIAPPEQVLQRCAVGDDDLDSELIRAAAEPFDLERGPLFRAVLLEPATGSPVLLVAVHHVVVDLWSTSVLVDELGEAYRRMRAGQPANLPAPVQHSDAVRRSAAVSQERLDERRKYWRDQLAGRLPILTLPDLRPRPPVQTFHGAVLRHQLPAEAGTAVAQLASASGTTVYVVLLSTLQVLLQRYTGEDDVLVGTPVAGRRHPDLAGVVGHLLNIVVLRGDLRGDPTFIELLTANRQALAEALAYQDHPFPALVEELLTVREPAHTPLFQVMLAYERAPGGDPIAGLAVEEEGVEIPLGGLRLIGRPLPRHTATFDLTLRVAEISGRLVTSWEYNTDVLDAGMVARLAQHLEVLLMHGVRRPEERVGSLPLLTPAEQKELRRWNATAAAAPTGRCMHELIADRARRSPSAIAVRAGDEAVTYEELMARAGTLADRLRARGVGPEARVGVYLRRSPDSVVSILATLMAGGAYVPLDPDTPQVRIAHILADVQPSVIVTDGALRELLPPTAATLLLVNDPETPPSATPSGVGPHNLAYVIYTSGSTGRPKGVMVEHRNLVSSTHARLGYFPDRIRSFLLISSLAFDSSVAGLFWTLYEGGTLILPDPNREQDPEHHRELLARHDVTHFESVPSLYLTLLRRLGRDELPALRSVVVAGEACTREVWDQHRALLPQARLVNEYGPTEGSVWCSAYRAGPDLRRAHLPIGRPIENATIHLLDRRGRPTPDGAVGEVYIGGAGVARGYHLQPEQTAERFLPDAFTEIPGARMYRTGDLARRLPGGDLEFVGRADRQVKIHGVRIELAEIESALQECPGIAEAAVRQATDERGAPMLVAHLVADSARPAPATGRLRAHLTERLPTAMIPARFGWLPALPLTAHGKVDDEALPAIGLEPDGTDAATSADQITQLLRDICADLLDRDRFGVDEDFFAAGGHSLLVTQLVSRIRSALGVAIPLRTVFAGPTVRELEVEIRAALGEAPAGSPTARGGAATAPLSYAQQRLWFVDRVLPGNPAYNIPVAVRLRGPLDVAVLSDTLTAVLRRHGALRTTIEQSVDGPVQRMHELTPFRLEVVDLAGADEVLDAVARAARQPFDLTTGPLVRGVLYRTGAQEHVLLLCIHHIVADGWSLAVLTDELAAGYEAQLDGRPDPVPDPPIQYGDYASWQREHVDPGTLRGQLARWTGQFADAPVLRLPTDRPRPLVQRFVGDVRPWQLDRESAAALREVARGTGATLFMVLLATFGLTLGRQSHSTDVVVGTPISGRTHTETEQLIGLFANTLALRLDLSGDPSFADLVARVREVCVGAYAHQDVPFELLVDALQPTRDLGRNPLFQVVFALQNTPRPAPRLAGLEVELLETTTGTAKFDLTVSVWETEDGMRGTFEYNTDLFDVATIDRLAADFTRLLRAAAAESHAGLSTLTAAGAAAVGPNRTPAVHLPAPLVDLIGRHAAERPAAVALAGDGTSVTYRELLLRAGALADEFRRHGAGPGTRVGLALRRSPEWAAALVAILSVGARCVPCEAGTDARAVPGIALLVDADGIHRPDAGTTDAGENGLDESALTPAAAAIRDAFGLVAGDRLLAYPCPGPRTLIAECIAALTVGAELVLADGTEPVRIAVERLRPAVVLLASDEVTVLTGADLPGLRVLCAGTRPPGYVDLAAPVLFRPDAPVPATTLWQRAPDGTWRGRPDPGTTVRVLDRFGSPVEQGVPGELHVVLPAGNGSEDGRATGALVRYRPGGDLEWLGSVVQQHDEGPLTETPFVEPRTAVERVVATVWAELLDLPRVGVHDDFFEVGGHSLLAMQVIARLAAVFQVEVPVQAFFEDPTIAGLAACLLDLRPAQAEQIALIWERVRNASPVSDQQLMPTTGEDHG